IRLHPTPEQERYFYRASGVARFAWNWALNEYKRLKAENLSVDWNQIKIDFRAKINVEFPFVREVTKCAAEEAISDLRKAINVYYKTKQVNPKSKVKFPGFRKRSKKVGGFGLANDKFRLDGHDAYIPKLGLVNMAETLRFEGKILSGRVKERAGKWYLTVTVEVESQARGCSLSGSVGIDFGLSSFATLSTGEVVETQARFRKSECKLKALQRGLARKKKGSRNRAKWKLKIARMHERISDQRKDFLHKFTTRVAATFAVVCIEDLNLAGLCQTRLAKSFAEAGIGVAAKQLEYKTRWFGGLLQKVDRFFASSKLCHCCGEKNDQLKLSDREWDCLNCGAHHNRDENASLNIKMEGIRLLAGDGYLGATPVDGKALACASA
ncbi:MAG: RNA-guided endonuclease InsQ/TnpB family protein, partial [Methylococcales bacterium]